MNIDKFLTDDFLNSMNDYVSILDTESCFLAINDQQMRIMGYQTKRTILKKTYAEFKGISTAVAEQFMHEDQMVLKNQRPLRYLSYQLYADNTWHLLLGDKTCLMDDHGNAVGIFSQAKDMTESRLIDFSRFMFDANRKYAQKKTKSGFDYIITNNGDINGLSEKEMVVLFYFLRGKTAREIAEIIFRSEKTINFHLDAIKAKFKVDSKSALIEKAIYDGFMNIIPQAIL